MSVPRGPLRRLLSSVRRRLLPRPTWDPQRIEAMYDRELDPWHLETSAYEQRKYADTLAALPRARYARGIEIGCSVGILSRMLATRCDAFVGVDLSERALDEARRNNAASAHTTFIRRRLPLEQPDGRYDLIMLSEVLYFFAEPDLRSIAVWVSSALEPAGHVVLVNHTGDLLGYPMTGARARSLFLSSIAPAIRSIAQHKADGYRIDIAEAGRQA